MKRLSPAPKSELAPANDTNFLGALLGEQLPTTTIEASSGGNFVPYVSFYSGREGNRGGSLTARDIADAIPGIAVGQPYLRNGDDIRAVDGPVVLTDLFTFYGTRDDDNQWVEAGPSDGDGEKPAAIAAMLCVFDDGVTPAVCETTGKAKSSAFFKIASEQQRKGKRLQARISGAAKSFDKEEKGKKKRIEYTQTMARCSPVDEETARRLAEFSQGEGAEAAVQALRDEFASRVDAVKALF